MGFLRRLLSGGREPTVHVGDPRFDDWEVVHTFERVDTALAFSQHLRGAGVEAALTSDWEPDHLGRGDIMLQVPPGEWSRAEEILSGLDLD